MLANIPYMDPMAKDFLLMVGDPCFFGTINQSDRGQEESSVVTFLFLVSALKKGHL